MLSPRAAVSSDTIDNSDGIAAGLKCLVVASRRAGHAMALIGPASERRCELVLDHPDEHLADRGHMRAELRELLVVRRQEVIQRRRSDRVIDAESELRN